MLFSKVLTVTFAAGAMAMPSTFYKRDLATIQAEFANISSAVAALDASILALTSSTDPATAIDTLEAESQNVTDALNAGTAIVSGTAALSLTDSISLLSSSQNLVNAVNKTITDLESKKSIVDAANADSIVVDQLQQQKTASQAFINAVVAKVPSSVQSIANQQATAVITALNNGITYFGGTVSKVKRTLQSFRGS
jgi:ribonuclease HI